MMDRGSAIAVGLLAGLLFLIAPAQAQITFRAASSSAIGFVAAGTQTTGTGSSIQPGIPAGTQAGDFAVLIVAGRPTDTSNPSTPSGWTLRSSSLREVGTNDLKIITFYRVLAGGDSNPTINLPTNWQAGGMSGQIAVWRGVDGTTPFDVTDVTSSSVAADQWTPTGITPANAGALVVSAVATADDNALSMVTAQGFTARMSGASYDTTTGVDHSVGVADELQPTVAAVTMPRWDQTLNGTDAWAGISFALRPRATAVTITKPAGTTTNDVMIASIAVRPQTLTIGMPSGWTLVRRLDNGSATQSTLAIYRKVAGASEPALYTWTLSGGTPTGAAGGIQTFIGVDTTTPVDVENGLSSTSASNSHSTPDVTTSVTNTMLVTSFAIPNADTWTPPSGMAEAFDALAVQIAVEGSYVLQAAAGATGVKTATSAPSAADNGNAHILALRPSCASVADASYVAGAAPTGASPNVTVYWSSGNAPLILRKSGTAFAGNQVPVHGTSYTAGQRPWGSAATDPYVIYNGSAAMAGITCNATSCMDASTGGTGLSNGTTYYYKVFPKNGTCYASGIGADINLTPVASGHSWSYTLAGGSMLKAGIAGEGAIYTGSNANRIVSVSTTNGTQTWAPVATSDAVQGWLSWIFISGGSESAVIGGDQSATVYSINPATGATNWTKDLSANGADAVQAPAAAQLWVLSDTTFQSTHATDLVFVATRNASTTNNKVFALRVSDGSVAWTFNGTGTSNVDYIVGQPWVDRTTNRLYVTSRAGGGSQASLWVLSTLNGALEASFPLGHIENSPTLSSTGATLWVANTSGQLYAINTVSLTQKWSSAAALGSAVKGFVWEDFTTAGRLYFSTADGNVWCLQDPGAGSPPNPASPVWKTLVAGASMPLLLDLLYVGSSDGKVHELNLITGADAKQFTLAGTVGDLSTENGTEVFAPTSAGKIYKIPVPLP